MHGPSLDETFASKGGQGIGNCGHTSASQRDSDRPQIIPKMQVLHRDDRCGINRGDDKRTTERPAVCLPVLPQGQCGSSVSLRTLRHKTVNNGLAIHLYVYVSVNLFVSMSKSNYSYLFFLFVFCTIHLISSTVSEYMV